MSKITFLFISCFFLLVALYSGVSEFNGPEQVIPAVVFIALLGIPHGAIDHVLFMEKSTWSPPLFYGFYLSLIGVYVLAWMMAPAFSMAVFLILSAYHFGQSQLSDLRLEGRFRRFLIYSFWGGSILSGLVVYNQPEIVELAATYADMAALSSIFDPGIHHVFLITFSGGFLLIAADALRKKQISAQRFAMELFVLFLIHFSFRVLPILTGFALSFVILHSLTVLSDEYGFLKSIKRRFNIRRFIGMLWPYTLLSLLGSAVILTLSHTGFLPISNILLVFILISVLTLPHSIVMEKFYADRKGA
jgi:Brp/Blh family beta-carotene 15,15'-monooxygenase